MALNHPDNPLAIEIEIRQEQAATYFAACRKMVDALEKLKAFDQLPAGASTQHQDLTKRKSELLQSAVERVHFVIIQREAMKLSWSETFFEDYGIPVEVRKRLGWRRIR